MFASVCTHPRTEPNAEPNGPVSAVDVEVDGEVDGDGDGDVASLVAYSRLIDLPTPCTLVRVPILIPILASADARASFLGLK